MNSLGQQILFSRKIHERARYLRGKFLNTVAVIERDIALIITDYFCNSDTQKRELFFRSIVTASFFSLRTKIEVLRIIVKNDYPRFWQRNNKALNILDKIIKFRNKLAHSVVDVSEAALSRPIEQGIGFIDWKKAEPISDHQFQEWEVKAHMVLSCLADIRRLLPFKEKIN